jgi:hypothetical protein
MTESAGDPVEVAGQAAQHWEQGGQLIGGGEAVSGSGPYEVLLMSHQSLKCFIYQEFHH